MGCPLFCTRCTTDTTCGVDCKAGDCEAEIAVKCPDGFECIVDCSLRGACRARSITCDGDCTILCEDIEACENAALRCLGDSCEISCDGESACDGSIDCSASACAMSCRSDTCTDVCCDGASCAEKCTGLCGWCQTGS